MAVVEDDHSHHDRCHRKARAAVAGSRDRGRSVREGLAAAQVGSRPSVGAAASGIGDHGHRSNRGVGYGLYILRMEDRPVWGCIEDPAGRDGRSRQTAAHNHGDQANEICLGLEWALRPESIDCVRLGSVYFMVRNLHQLHTAPLCP